MTVSTVTLDRLRTFNVRGFLDALIAQSQSSTMQGLSFEERLTLLVDCEHTRRCNQKTARLLRAARISSAASLDQVDFSVMRKLNKALLLDLCQASWLQRGTNLVITGPTGIGKTFLASVIGHSLCQKGFSVKLQRTHQWLSDLLLADDNHRLPQAIAGFRKIPLIIFDEWMRDPLSAAQARLLLDFVDDRYGIHSTAFVSQFPVPDWHARFEDPTLADALLDRIVHNAVRIELSGDSMRKYLAPALHTGQDVASLR